MRPRTILQSDILGELGYANYANEANPTEGIRAVIRHAKFFVSIA